MAFNVTRITMQGQPVSGASEMVELSITGVAASGTFTLTFGGQTTTAIAYDAAAAAVQAALVALSSVGAGGVACTGGPLPSTPVVITFTGALAGTNVGSITSTDSLVGVAPATALNVTTQGVAGSYRGVIRGAVLIDEKNGALYTNTGTAGVPIWTAWSDIQD